MVTYLARSVGIPARQTGTPCWNSVFGGIDYRGLARDNPNVSTCWSGGLHGGRGKVGGGMLNNHNWVEWWDSDRGDWVFQNVPPTSAEPNSPTLCPHYADGHGCGWDPTEGCDKSHPRPIRRHARPRDLQRDVGKGARRIFGRRHHPRRRVDAEFGRKGLTACLGSANALAARAKASEAPCSS